MRGMTRAPYIAEVALFTPDVAGATAFYEQLLGMPPKTRSPAHAEFELGETTLFIHVAGDGGSHGAPNADHVALAVADPDAVADGLRQGGVDVDGPREFYWGRSAYLRDPDGRVIELKAP